MHPVIYSFSLPLPDDTDAPLGYVETWPTGSLLCERPHYAHIMIFSEIPKKGSITKKIKQGDLQGALAR